MFTTSRPMMMRQTSGRQYAGDLNSRILRNLCRQYGGTVYDENGDVTFTAPEPKQHVPAWGAGVSRGVRCSTPTQPQPAPAPRVRTAAEVRADAIRIARDEHKRTTASNGWGMVRPSEAAHVSAVLRLMKLEPLTAAEAKTLSNQPPRRPRR